MILQVIFSIVLIVALISYSAKTITGTVKLLRELRQQP